jgi:MFS family permease
MALTQGVDRRAMATLSAGHLFTDIAQGSIPALLPFLIAKDHLSYAAASALVLAATISSSVIQPLFGHVSDRLSLPWLMPLGPALGGLGVALAGIAPSYALTFRGDRRERDRPGRLPPRGVAVRQLRLGIAPGERDEPVLREGQHRLRAGAGAGHAADAGLRPGAATIATFAVTIVMGQEYLPGRLGVAAGVTIGLSIGLGGVGAPLLGVLADAHGLREVFETIAVLPVLALVLVLALPRREPAVDRREIAVA